MYIQMIGDCGKCSTSWILLDNIFRDDFELGRTDKFIVEAKDVGLPDVIRLSKTDWL